MFKYQSLRGRNTLRRTGAVIGMMAALTVAVASCGEERDASEDGYRIVLSSKGESHAKIHFPANSSATPEEQGEIVCVDNYKGYKDTNAKKVHIRIGQFIIPSSFPGSAETDLSGEGGSIDRCNIYAPKERHGDLKQLESIGFTNILSLSKNGLVIPPKFPPMNDPFPYPTQFQE